jgi:hypothetical protein
VREAVYAALWALVSGDARVQAAFRTLSRYTRHFEETDGHLMPALFQLQKSETWQQVGRGIPPKRTLNCHFLVYTNTAAPAEQLPSTALNVLLDVLDDVLAKPANGSYVQTLGGLVNHVYIEGEIQIAEGLLQPKSIVAIPITMLIP